MSGVEIAGVLLGAFPLCISAMEHYEESRRVAGTFLKIRRAHRKDLGKVKDCQLMFKLNLKELLIPLLHDEVVQQAQYEELLANPGGPSWREDDVDMALSERLDECHERYIEILQEMQETMTALCEASKVDDIQFQEHLKAKTHTKASSTPSQQAQTQLLFRANDHIVFQAKRVNYAFTGTRREALLEELEAQNNKLQKVLASSDRVAAIPSQKTHGQRKPISSKSLKFWRHADNIYNILKATWKCTCRSCASLWLQQRPMSLVQMEFVMPFCHGRKGVHVKLSDKPITLPLRAPRPTRPGHSSVPQSTTVPSISIQSHSVAASAGSSSSRSSSTATYVSQAAVMAPRPQNQPSTARGSQPLNHHGLCNILSTQQQLSSCIGTVFEGDDEYAIYPSMNKASMDSSISLADMLGPASQIRLNRVQRYGIALTLASSHLQLHSTPWIKEYWTAEDVHFPLTYDSNNVATLHGEPYILARFENSNPVPARQKDRSFSTLGIVLLELCFGCLLEDHKLWQNPVYAPLKDDPIIRQTVACEWLDDVQGEAGDDYFLAANWTLRQAPAVIKDDKWREEFAANVVQPLLRNYEHLQPGKSK